jgi:hypothetical protein
MLTSEKVADVAAVLSVIEDAKAAALRLHDAEKDGPRALATSRAVEQIDRAARVIAEAWS